MRGLRKLLQIYFITLVEDELLNCAKYNSYDQTMLASREFLFPFKKKDLEKRKGSYFTLTINLFPQRFVLNVPF